MPEQDPLQMHSDVQQNNFSSEAAARAWKHNSCGADTLSAPEHAKDACIAFFERHGARHFTSARHLLTFSLVTNYISDEKVIGNLALIHTEQLQP